MERPSLGLVNSLLTTSVKGVGTCVCVCVCVLVSNSTAAAKSHSENITYERISTTSRYRDDRDFSHRLKFLTLMCCIICVHDFVPNCIDSVVQTIQNSIRTDWSLNVRRGQRHDRFHVCHIEITHRVSSSRDKSTHGMCNNKNRCI